MKNRTRSRVVEDQAVEDAEDQSPTQMIVTTGPTKAAAKKKEADVLGRKRTLRSSQSLPNRSKNQVDEQEEEGKRNPHAPRKYSPGEEAKLVAATGKRRLTNFIEPLDRKDARQRIQGRNDKVDFSYRLAKDQLHAETRHEPDATPYDIAYRSVIDQGSSVLSINAWMRRMGRPQIYTIYRPHGSPQTVYFVNDRWCDIPEITRCANATGKEAFLPMEGEKLLRRCQFAANPQEQLAALTEYANYLAANKFVLVILPFYRNAQRFLELGIGMKNFDVSTQNKARHFQSDKFRDQHVKIGTLLSGQSQEIQRKGFVIKEPTQASIEYGRETESMRVQYIKEQRSPGVQWGHESIDTPPAVMHLGDFCSMHDIEDVFAKLYIVLQWGFTYWAAVSTKRAKTGKSDPRSEGYPELHAKCKQTLLAEMRGHFLLKSSIVKGVSTECETLFSQLLSSGDAVNHQEQVQAKIAQIVTSQRNFPYKTWLTILQQFRWILQSRVEARLDLARFGSATSPQMLEFTSYVGYQSMRCYWKDKPAKMPKQWDANSSQMITKLLQKILTLITPYKSQQMRSTAIQEILYSLSALVSVAKSGKFGIDFLWDRRLRDILVMFNTEAVSAAQKYRVRPGCQEYFNDFSKGSGKLRKLFNAVRFVTSAERVAEVKRQKELKPFYCVGFMNPVYMLAHLSGAKKWPLIKGNFPKMLLAQCCPLGASASKLSSLLVTKQNEKLSKQPIVPAIEESDNLGQLYRDADKPKTDSVQRQEETAPEKSQAKTKAKSGGATCTKRGTVRKQTVEPQIKSILKKPTMRQVPIQASQSLERPVRKVVDAKKTINVNQVNRRSSVRSKYVVSGTGGQQAKVTPQPELLEKRSRKKPDFFAAYYESEYDKDQKKKTEKMKVVAEKKKAQAQSKQRRTASSQAIDLVTTEYCQSCALPVAECWDPDAHRQQEERDRRDFEHSKKCRERDQKAAAKKAIDKAAFEKLKQDVEDAKTRKEKEAEEAKKQLAAGGEETVSEVEKQADDVEKDPPLSQRSIRQTTIDQRGGVGAKE